MKKFVIKKQLTNTKPPRTDEPILITTPTDGGFRMTEAAASIVGLRSGDYAQILIAGDENESLFVLAKGTPPNAETGTKAVGAKLASPNDKIGSALTFSAAFAYKEMFGGQGKNRIYAVKEEPVELEIEEGVTITGYVLEHIRDEEPVARESKTEAEKAEAVAENA